VKLSQECKTAKQSQNKQIQPGKKNKLLTCTRKPVRKEIRKGTRPARAIVTGSPAKSTFCHGRICCILNLSARPYIKANIASHSYQILSLD